MPTPNNLVSQAGYIGCGVNPLEYPLIVMKTILQKEYMQPSTDESEDYSLNYAIMLIRT
jgi:hypothetical protein